MFLLPKSWKSFELFTIVLLANSTVDESTTTTTTTDDKLLRLINVPATTAASTRHIDSGDDPLPIAD